jgi:hypothetical protein
VWDKDCGGIFSLLSLKVNRELEGRLPAPGLPGPFPCLTSRRACAPKLRRLPRGELFGGLFGASSSSMTAGSSPKLLRNSGEPDDEVATEALLCLANAAKGEFCVWPEGDVVVSPRAVIEVPLRCWGGLGDGCTADEGGDDDIAF